MLKKLLIADPSVDFRAALSDELQHVCAIRTCADGVQALELLRSYRPDFIVMDLMLPGIDGLTVLHRARQEGICPPALVTSTFFSPYATQNLDISEVVYRALKPCDISSLADRIRDLGTYGAAPLVLRPAPQAAITAALMELGAVPGRGGFHYCREAIEMLAENPTLQVTKHIYPEIGKRHGCTANAVEKGIRDVIGAAYANRSEAVWRRYFTPAPNGRIARPTNRVFLHTVTEILFCVEVAAK